MSLPESPNSNVEQYLSKISGQASAVPEAPNSRVEQYLEYIAQNGTVSKEEIAEQVSEWLEENIHEDPTVVIDASLSVSGAAADAKATGDEIAELKADLSDVESTIYCDAKRITASYLTGTDLNNAYVWISKDVFVPKGQSGKLVCLNQSDKRNDGKTLHIILLSTSDGESFKILNDITVLSVSTGVNVYISKELTSEQNVYFGFYSTNAGIIYQTTGDRRTAFTRYEYNNDAVGTIITASGSFSLDFSFGLFVTKDETYTGKSIVVDASGNGDYATVITAITTEPENTVIVVKPGIYEQDMTECLRKRIILIGTDRNQCVIRDTDGRYGHHPLYVSCGYFENLTIEAPYISGTSQEVGVSDLGAYAVHIDTDEDYAIGKTCEFHHCTISSDFFPAVGLGMRKDATYIFDDCELVNGQIVGRGDYSDEGTLGALYFHDSNGTQGDQYIKIKDCVLKSNLAYAMCPYKVNRTPQNNRVYCDFVNNVLYSATGKYANTVWFRGDPFNPSTGIFSIGIGYGNSIASLNNN